MEPIGYFVGGDADNVGQTPLCPICYIVDDDGEGDPIKQNTERDSPTHCERCGELIPHNLTDFGRGYVEEAISMYLANMGGDPDTILSWWQAYRSLFESDSLYEMVDYSVRVRAMGVKK